MQPSARTIGLTDNWFKDSVTYNASLTGVVSIASCSPLVSVGTNQLMCQGMDSYTIASFTRVPYPTFSVNGIIKASNIQAMEDRITALEGRTSTVARIIVPYPTTEPVQVVIINGWVPVAIAAIILAKRTLEWIHRTIERGKILAQFERPPVVPGKK
jgi:hypothetical protein